MIFGKTRSVQLRRIFVILDDDFNQNLADLTNREGIITHIATRQNMLATSLRA